MPKQSKRALPLGVIARKDRPGLYRMRVMIKGQQFIECYRSEETRAKKLRSELQKAYDTFRDKAEKSMLTSGDISDKSTFAQAVEWFIGIRKLEIRESTQLVDNFTFKHYLVPHLGHYKLKDIIPPMITKLLAELLEKGGGGGRAVFTAKQDFIRLMYEKKPPRSAGGFKLVACELNIGVDNTFVRVRKGQNCGKEIAEKVSKYFGVSLSTAFDKKAYTKPLSASYVSKITYTLSALFSACVKNGVIMQNPVENAIKPRIGEKDIPAYLDAIQIPIFLDALNTLAIDNSVRVSLKLMLMLGLRSGEARGLRWIDIDFTKGIISIEKNCGVTLNGLALTDLKTKRSRRKLHLFPEMHGILLEHKAWLDEYSKTLGYLWKDNGLICPNPTGGLMGKASPNNVVKRILAAKQELPQDLHAHSMRHSFVSLLISDGLGFADVAALAGDTIDIIIKHYAHSFAERRAAAMGNIGTIFAALSKKPTPPLLVTN